MDPYVLLKLWGETRLKIFCDGDRIVIVTCNISHNYCTFF